MSSWELFSSHGLVLIYFSRHPRARLRDAAEAIGLTERAVQNNIRDLAASGHLQIEKVGRRNRYRVVGRKHLTHPTTRSVSLRQLLQLFKLNDQEDSALVTPVVKVVSKKQKQQKASEDAPKSVAEPAWTTAKEKPIEPHANIEIKAVENTETKSLVDAPTQKDATQQSDVIPPKPVVSVKPVKLEKSNTKKTEKPEKDDDLPQQDLLF